MIHQWLDIPPSDILVILVTCLTSWNTCRFWQLWYLFSQLELEKIMLNLNFYPNMLQVVLSQYGGSNRGGFTIVSSSSKGTIRLDGLFNVISYDLVPKLQKLLMASDFKVRSVKWLCGIFALCLCWQSKYHFIFLPITHYTRLERLIPEELVETG